MTLFNELNAALQRHGRPCRVQEVAEELGEDGEQLLSAVESGQFPLSLIVNVLASRGVVISAESLRKHRLKRCRCVAEG